MNTNHLVAVGGVAAVQPTIWSFLGYQFEAAPMVVSLFACLMVRAYRGNESKSYSFKLDVPISSLTILFTAGAMINFRPDPLPAIVIGTGLGAAGEILISQAQKWVAKYFGSQDVFPAPTSADRTHFSEGFDEQIRRIDDKTKGPNE